MNRKPRSTGVGALAAAAAAIVTVLVVILLSSPQPVRTVTTFLTGPWSNRYALGNVLARASLLVLTGTGVVTAFRAGTFNLGGEGQTYLGAIVVTAVLTHPEIVATVGVSVTLGIAVTLAVTTTACMAGLSGWLRHTTGADELITSFLLAAAVMPVGDYLIIGPLRDQSSNLLATRLIPETARLTRLLMPSAFNTTAIWALVAVLALWFMLNWTLFGYEMRITGYNRAMARYSGMPVGRYTTLPMALSGALHGLAGSALVLGVHYRSITGFTGGLGWNGIAVALIARNNPVLIVPAALFFAFLDGGARAAVLQDQTTWELGSLVQGVVFLFVTAQLLSRYRQSRRRQAVGVQAQLPEGDSPV
jgi:riboflavin transport system permease protein